MSLAVNVMQHFIITATIYKIENLHCEKIVKILNMVLLNMVLLNMVLVQILIMVDMSGLERP